MMNKQNIRRPSTSVWAIFTVVVYAALSAAGLHAKAEVDRPAYWLEQAEAMLTAIESERDRAHVQSRLAVVYGRLGEIEPANTHMEAAAKLIEKTADEAWAGLAVAQTWSRVEQHTVLEPAAEHLADLIADGRLEEARAYVLEADQHLTFRSALHQAEPQQFRLLMIRMLA